jgi:cobaltochelatase CobS
MSKGKINKPRQQEQATSSLEKEVRDIVYKLVETCEVSTDDTEWKEADQTLQDKLSNIEKTLGTGQGNISEEIKEIQKQIAELKERKPLELTINLDNKKKIDLGLQHFQFPDLVKMISTGLNIFLVGPAGSGKTTAAINVAKALGVEFHFTGAIASEFKLTGFINASGGIVSTEFRKAYENGGLFLFDEIDASYPQAVLAFNAALSNNYMDFPDKRITRHEKFYCIAAANTYGQGADRQYVGRNQLDAASLDRFVFIDWKYDEKLETELAKNEEWSTYVQKARKVVENLKIRHVVSPRASMHGATLLAIGIERAVVEKTCLWKGMDEATIQKVKSNIETRR